MNSKITKWNIIAIIFTIIGCFISITLLLIINYNGQRVHVEYIDTTIPNISYITQINTKFIYNQPKILDLEINDPETIVLLDKSGSMKDFVTDVYLQNAEYFSNNATWCFDTKVYEVSSINSLEYAHDTDVFTAINTAITYGYTNILIFSDMEHTSGEFVITDIAKNIKIYIFSPNSLSEESMKTINFLKDCDGILSIKQFLIN